MVRTDWSQGKDVQDLEPKLTDLFKDITLSDDLRANTQRAASQVLFPRKFVATYQRQGFASLFAWMNRTTWSAPKKPRNCQSRKTIR